MAKKGKIITSEPCVYSPPPYTAEQQESDFKRGYEFNKPVPARSPVGGWEYKYMNDKDPFTRTPAKEKALVKGNSHSFKSVRTANSYGSRPAVKSGGHRIGSRKK
jgi:hypothetical protein